MREQGSLLFIQSTELTVLFPFPSGSPSSVEPLRDLHRPPGSGSPG